MTEKQYSSTEQPLTSRALLNARAIAAFVVTMTIVYFGYWLSKISFLPPVRNPFSDALTETELAALRVRVAKPDDEIPRIRKLFPILMAVTCCLPWLTACSDKPNLPEPPLSFPFDTQAAGFKIETDVRVVEHNSYRFGFRLGFKEGDASDRARVVLLAGSPERNSTGVVIRPGVPITVRLKIRAVNPSAIEHEYEKVFSEQQMNGCSATDCKTIVTDLRLKPGLYHFEIENQNVVPALKNTSIVFTVTTDPKSSSIPD